MLLFDKIKERGLKLILASQSPRRSQLMADCGLEFEVMGYDLDEEYPDTLAAAEVPEYLARLKSEGFPHDLAEDQIVVTADTVVICDGRILGKPQDEEVAKEMLRTISHREHRVVTGVAIRSHERIVSFSCESTVFFRELSAEEIDYYVEKYKPLDKAGSYGIQEWIGYIGIERIEGSFYNVMGLPIQRLYTELKNFIS